MANPDKLRRDIRKIIELCVCSLCEECDPAHKKRCITSYKEQANEIANYLYKKGYRRMDRE